MKRNCYFQYFTTHSVHLVLSILSLMSVEPKITNAGHIVRRNIVLLRHDTFLAGQILRQSWHSTQHDTKNISQTFDL